MKTFRILMTAMIVFLTSLAACAGNRLFSNLPKSDNLSVVYISKAMMRMGLSMAGNDGALGKVKGSIKNANGMEIVSADSPATVDLLRKETASKIKDLHLESMLSTRDGEESVNIFCGKMINDNSVRDILIVTDEPNEYNVIYIQGDIDINSLSQISSKSN